MWFSWNAMKTLFDTLKCYLRITKGKQNSDKITLMTLSDGHMTKLHERPRRSYCCCPCSHVNKCVVDPRLSLMLSALVEANVRSCTISSVGDFPLRFRSGHWIKVVGKADKEMIKADKI